MVEKPLFPCGVSCCFPAEAGTSLTIQRLRLLASTARGLSPGQGSSPCPRGAAKKKKKKSLTEAEAGACQDDITSALPGTERSRRTEGGVESPDARLTSPSPSAHRTTDMWAGLGQQQEEAE